MTNDPAMAGDAASDRTALRDRILIATLPNVLFDGWTGRALAVAADALDLDPATARQAFPGGSADLVAHFSDWADRRMLECLAADEAFAAMRVRDKIARAVRLRLEILEPHQEAVRRAAAVLALPGNAGLGARLLYRTVDAMWRAAGDTATDVNFYTKRGLLAGVQAATTLYWLADHSAGHEASWAFLDRRIGDVLAVGRRFGRLSGLVRGPFRAVAGLGRRAGRAG